MATTDPLTGATIQDQSDAATGGTQIGNAVKNLRSFTIPRFTTTGARDTAYTSFVSGGGVMADGMHCTAAGVPYRRINGVWRVNRPRVITRFTSPSSTISSGGGNETGVTAGIPALANFDLYEAGTVTVNATFRGAPAGGAASFAVKIDNAQVGDQGIVRSDVTTSVSATLALAAGSHAISLRCDASGGAVTWYLGRVVLTEGIAE